MKNHLDMFTIININLVDELLGKQSLNANSLHKIVTMAENDQLLIYMMNMMLLPVQVYILNTTSVGAMVWNRSSALFIITRTFF